MTHLVFVYFLYLKHGKEVFRAQYRYIPGVYEVCRAANEAPLQTRSLDMKNGGQRCGSVPKFSPIVELDRVVQC